MEVSFLAVLAGAATAGGDCLVGANVLMVDPKDVPKLNVLGLLPVLKVEAGKRVDVVGTVGSAGSVKSKMVVTLGVAGVGAGWFLSFFPAMICSAQTYS